MDRKNPNEKQRKEIHWASLINDINTDVCFNYFGIEYIPQEILKDKFKDKFITHIITRIQDNHSIMYG